MRFTRFHPDPRLRELVQTYRELDVALLDQPEEQHVMPEGSVRLTFSTGLSWRKSGPLWVSAPPVTLSGLQLWPQPSMVRGAFRALVAELFPWGARQLLGWRAQTSQTELDHLVSEIPVGREIPALLEQGEWDTARRVLEAWLLSVWAERATEAGKGRRAAERIYRASGHLRITSVAEELNIGARQLERQFAQQVGINAKTLARLVRFDEARRRLRRDPRIPTIDLAHALGFFDQAHLTNEFRSLTRMPPQAFAALAARRPDATRQEPD